MAPPVTTKGGHTNDLWSSVETVVEYEYHFLFPFMIFIVTCGPRYVLISNVMLPVSFDTPALLISSNFNVAVTCSVMHVRAHGLKEVKITYEIYLVCVFVHVGV